MGVEGYAILGYRKSKLTTSNIKDLLSALMATDCRTEHWMKWYGPHADNFDRILVEYSNLAEFVLFIIAEEGNTLEVASYAHGKMTKQTFSMMTIEMFTGYSHKEFSKLPSKELENWLESYDAYRKGVQSCSATNLKLTSVILKADEEDVSSESEEEEIPAKPVAKIQMSKADRISLVHEIFAKINLKKVKSGYTRDFIKYKDPQFIKELAGIFNTAALNTWNASPNDVTILEEVSRYGFRYYNETVL